MKSWTQTLSLQFSLFPENQSSQQICKWRELGRRWNSHELWVSVNLKLEKAEENAMERQNYCCSSPFLTPQFLTTVRKERRQDDLSSMFSPNHSLIVIPTKNLLFQRSLHLSHQRETEVIFGLNIFLPDVFLWFRFNSDMWQHIWKGEIQINEEKKLHEPRRTVHFLSSRPAFYVKYIVISSGQYVLRREEQAKAVRWRIGLSNKLWAWRPHFKEANNARRWFLAFCINLFLLYIRSPSGNTSKNNNI